MLLKEIIQWQLHFKKMKDRQDWARRYKHSGQYSYYKTESQRAGRQVAKYRVRNPKLTELSLFTLAMIDQLFSPSRQSYRRKRRRR